MNNIFLFAVTLISIFSFTQKSILTIKDDPNVQEIFNSDEIPELDMIIKYFDSTIITNTKNQNIAQAYHEFFEKISNNESLQDLKKILDNDNDTKAFIKKFKNRKVFKEIWKYSYDYRHKPGDISYMHLSLNLQGKYFKLLKSIGKNNVFIKEYVNSVQSAGCINPSLIAFIIKNHNAMDFQKPANRLFWAVHYITILSE
jgi:hypothetical protein